MPTHSLMCDYCQRADEKARVVPTKVHGTLRLCERCENHCRAKGWLKESQTPTTQEAA